MIRLLPPALLVLLLLVACAPGDDDGGTTLPTGDEQVITVTLTEHEIELSGEATAGEVFFVFNNTGEQAHGFVVSGPDFDETLTSDVQPGARQRANVELGPGTYTVWCPIGDHRDRGMEAELEISEAGS